MKKKCKVVMLPTEKASTITTHSSNGCLYITGSKPRLANFVSLTNQHLYLISDDEIKEGDWFYNEMNKIVVKATNRYSEMKNPIPHKKVIASTDELLDFCGCGGRLNDKNETYHKMGCRNKYYLPQIPESFIKAYAEANGIDEVMVEFDKIDGHLVITDNNEVIVSMVGDSNNPTTQVIGRFLPIDEVEKLCKVAYRYGAQNHEDATIERFDKWKAGQIFDVKNVTKTLP